MTLLAIVDNDLVEKAAAVCLLPELHDILGVSEEGLRILSTARWRYTEKRRGRAVGRLGEATVDSILQFCDRTAKAPEVDPADAAVLAAIPNIDDGELILISYASRQPDALLATGDKRCLNALAAASSASGFMQKLSGRVICFEQVVVRAVAKLGFEEVRARIAPNITCDGALRAAFGSGMQAEWSNVDSTLTGFIANLRSSTRQLLVDF